MKWVKNVVGFLWVWKSQCNAVISAMKLESRIY